MNPDMTDLKNKIAVVFGGASGIGAATAERFKRDGMVVIIVGLPADVLMQSAHRLGLMPLVCDVRDADQVNTVIQKVHRRHGRIDVLVNAAGILVNDHVGDIMDDIWQQQIDINLTGAMHVMRAVLPIMQTQHSGSIVNIASVAAFNAGADMATYAASKAGLVALTRSAAAHYGADQIRINAICPGWVDTPMSQKEMLDLAQSSACSVPEAVQKTVTRIALGRMAAPAEIANVCSFLASEDASFITGAALVVDGGARTPASARSH